MMTTSPYNSTYYVEDTWLEFSSSCSQMLGYVNPDEICPVEQLHQQPLTAIYQQQQPHYQNQQHQQQYQMGPVQQAQQAQGFQQVHQVQPYQQLMQPIGLVTTYEHNKDLTQAQESKQTARLSPQLDSINRSFPLDLLGLPDNKSQDEHSSDVSNDEQNSLPPPPVLIPRDEDRHMNIKQRLDYERALSQQRQEQLRQQLEREPPKLPPNIVKKSPGKKMTGRERQLELERTEEELIKQRDHYVEMISRLESKCQRLRELLGDIVINSPEYNQKFVSCLESDDLFIDSHINGLTN